MLQHIAIESTMLVLFALKSSMERATRLLIQDLLMDVVVAETQEKCHLKSRRSDQAVVSSIVLFHFQIIHQSNIHRHYFTIQNPIFYQ